MREELPMSAKIFTFEKTPYHIWVKTINQEISQPCCRNDASERNATMKTVPNYSLLPTHSAIWNPQKFPTIHINTLHGDAVLLVDVDDELHLVVGAEEDSAAVVDALGDNGEHACHVAVDCLAAGC